MHMTCPEPVADLNLDWNLELAALTGESPRSLLPRVRSAALTAGAWILSEGAVGPQSAELDLEMPRSAAMGLYAGILESGLDLTADSHAQLQQLLGCTGMVPQARHAQPVRMHLNLYAREGSELFLGEHVLRPGSSV
jgi:hypothetical protein